MVWCGGGAKISWYKLELQESVLDAERKIRRPVVLHMVIGIGLTSLSGN
jgi:hypothetical protein